MKIGDVMLVAEPHHVRLCHHAQCEVFDGDFRIESQVLRGRNLAAMLIDDQRAHCFPETMAIGSHTGNDNRDGYRKTSASTTLLNRPCAHCFADSVLRNGLSISK